LSDEVRLKFWCYNSGLQLKGSVNAHKGKVRSIRRVGSKLYSGGKDGLIQVWEIDSLEDVRKLKHVTSIKAHNRSILTLNVYKGCLVTGGVDGFVKVR